MQWDSSSNDEDDGEEDGNACEDGEDDDEDEAYTTSNDFDPTPQREVNGSHRSKGAGLDGFGDAEGDDEDIYGL